jgi:subtilisin family serine protease
MLFFGFFEVVYGQPGEPDYYFVEGQKIVLTPSQNYSALKIKPGISTPDMQSFEAGIDSAGFGKVDVSPALQKYNIILVRIKEGIAPSSFRAGTEDFSTRNIVEAENPVYGVGGIDQVLVNEFIVQFKPELSEQDITQSLSDQQAEIIKKDEKIENRYVVKFTGKTAKEALMFSNEYSQRPAVVFSEPNFIRIYPQRPEIKKEDVAPKEPSPDTTPGDPYYPNQWYLNNNGTVGIEDDDVDAPEAWDVSKGSSSVIIAIIDEGVDIGHRDLSSKIVTPYDATDGDNNQDPNAWDGHGTACAGIAAAVTDNGIGVAGIGWHSKIMPIRIAYSSYDGGPWITTSLEIEDGLRTAVDRGAKVLSNSWGGGTPSSAINAGIDYAIANNCVVVFSAGNWRAIYGGPKEVFYPANLSTSKVIITVSATNEWDKLKTPTSADGETWWGSCFGPEVSVSAPGVHMWTTDISGSAGYGSGDYIGTFNGTSSAAPLVAGIASLLLAENPGWTPNQVRNQIQNTADDLGSSGFDNEYGYGRVNACKALGDHCDNCATIGMIAKPVGNNIDQILVNIALLFSTVLVFMLYLFVRKIRKYCFNN